MRTPRWARPVAVLALVSVAVGGCTGGASSGPGSQSRPSASAGAAGASTAAPALPVVGASGQGTVYIHYYLWWTPGHWRSRLGDAYPLDSPAPPLPGSVDSDGCGARTNYSGGQLLDLPAEGLYDQAQASTFDRHIATAAAAGVHGFLVSWKGAGTADQTTTSVAYNARLDLLVQRVDAYNSAHRSHFSLGLAFASFGDYNRPVAQTVADLRYFQARYGADPAFANPYSPKPLVMWLDSRKYQGAAVAAVSAAVEPWLYLIGDETESSWSRDAPYLDGTSYYWSTQNPYTNTRAKSAIDSLGAAVHAQGKRWFAPLIAGYNKQLLGGSCVPRNGVATLDTIWAMNRTSSPDGWFAISWNELVENTYLEPSQRYGAAYLSELSRLIAG